MATKSLAAILTASMLLLAAPPARADGLIIPFIGADFGGDAANCRQIVPCTSKQLSYGLGVSFMVGGVVGFEGEIADAPHFFGESTGRGDNHVLSVMGNMLVGIPIKAFRPVRRRWRRRAAHERQRVDVGNVQRAVEQQRGL